jgi:putative RNA 2'-phosphotransferase
MATSIVQLSKFLSLVLRHQPDVIGLTLDEQGWASVDELLAKTQAHGRPLSRPLLERIVAENDKKRFAFSEDGQRIRASQGHSIEVDLALQPTPPPDRLYHGTATRFVESIRTQGLLPGSRQHVHLSRDEATAVKVGQRHGKPAILIVRAAEMAAAGHRFFISDNGVWLTDRVPTEFIDFPNS